MGASQSREGTDAAAKAPPGRPGTISPGRPGAISPGNKYVVQAPAPAQALQALLNPVRTEHHSLDRTLKGFLKHCNLGGLEYRLRLAGIYTLEDLVHTDETRLCRHGFTQLMAKRLYDSLDEYLAEPEEITPPVPLRRRPSEMVRRVQMPFTRASTLMRSRKNFGKMNTKRVSVRGRTPPPPRKQRPVSLRMPDEEKVSQEGSFLISPTHYPELLLSQDNMTPVNPASPTGPLSAATPINDSRGTAAEYDNIPTLIESLPPIDPNSEFDIIPSVVDGRNSTSSDTNATPTQTTPTEPTPIGPAQSILLEVPQAIERCISVPDGIHRLEDRLEEQDREEERAVDTLSSLRGSMSLSSSSPSLFGFGEGREEGSPYHSQEADPVQEALDTLHDSLGQLEDVVSSMYVLLDFLKQGYWVVTHPTDLEALIKNINQFIDDLELVELGSRVMKYVTFQTLKKGASSLRLEAELSLALCQCIVNALKLYPHSQRVQLNGTQALANLVRLDVSLGDALLNARLFPHFTTTLQLYGDHESMSLSLLNTLASISASITSAGDELPLGFESVLKETVNVMLLQSHNIDIQTYGLSFITLSLIDVAAWINAGLMKDVVTAIINSVNIHSDSPDVAVGACKALSEVASHEVLQEEALRELVTGCLLSVLADHSKSSKVQMWASYALYQQVSYNKSLLPLVQDTGVIEKCQKTLPHLSKEAQSYLQNLTEMASL